jgi:glycerol-3-phosphate dehydrogenase (NAD+)
VKETAIAISLTKGMRVRKDGPQLISQLISSKLRLDCSVLMGANIATDIGREELSEATLGYTSPENAALLVKLFQRPYFLVAAVPDAVRAHLANKGRKTNSVLCVSYSELLKHA